MRNILLVVGFCLVGSSHSVFSAESKSSNSRVIEVAVTEQGFVPNSVQASAGDVVTLVFTRKTDSTCATSVVVPKNKIKEPLPLNKPVTVKLGKLEKGKISFGCGMGMMMGGSVVVL
jgi:plastocyanin domain-containing protein